MLSTMVSKAYSDWKSTSERGLRKSSGCCYRICSVRELMASFNEKIEQSKPHLLLRRGREAAGRDRAQVGCQRGDNPSCRASCDRGEHSVVQENETRARERENNEKLDLLSFERRKKMKLTNRNKKKKKRERVEKKRCRNLSMRLLDSTGDYSR